MDNYEFFLWNYTPLTVYDIIIIIIIIIWVIMYAMLLIFSSCSAILIIYLTWKQFLIDTVSFISVRPSSCAHIINYFSSARWKMGCQELWPCGVVVYSAREYKILHDKWVPSSRRNERKFTEIHLPSTTTTTLRHSPRYFTHHRTYCT